MEIYDGQGALVVVHESLGERPTETVEPASQLPLLCRKPAGWPNSRVRATLPDDLRAWMDAMDEEQRRSALRIMRGCRRRERLRSHGGRHGAGIRARAIAGQGLCAARRIRHMQRSGRDRLRGESGLRCLRCGFLDDGEAAMVPKATERAAVENRIREGARRLCLSNDTVGWFLERATPRQLDAVAGLVDHELSVREANRKSRLLRKAAFRR